MSASSYLHTTAPPIFGGDEAASLFRDGTQQAESVVGSPTGHSFDQEPSVSARVSEAEITKDYQPSQTALAAPISEPDDWSSTDKGGSSAPRLQIDPPLQDREKVDSLYDKMSPDEKIRYDQFLESAVACDDEAQSTEYVDKAAEMLVDKNEELTESSPTPFNDTSSDRLLAPR